MLLVCPRAVHNKNDFSLRQSAVFGSAHQPADGSALRVRRSVSVCCCMWARKVSHSLVRMHYVTMCKVDLLRMQGIVEENWATELFWFPLNGVCGIESQISRVHVIVSVLVSISQAQSA